MSIRGRLLLLTLLATLLPALLVLARFIQERERAIEADTARLVFIAQRRSETIAEKIQGTTQLLFGLSRASDLLTNDREACSAFLSRVREANAQYTGILTIKPDGTLFCDSLRTGRQLDLRDRAYFKAAKSEQDEVIFEPAFGRLTGAAVLQIAHPVRSASGELVFVLLASLNLKPLLELDTLPVPGARLLLLDDKGVVLAKSRFDDAGDPVGTVGASIAGSSLFGFVSAQRGRATQEIADPAGALGVWTTADSPITRRAGLRVVVGSPRSALVANADRRLRQDSALLAAAALGIFLAVWGVAEASIRRQVARITQMAGRLSAGDLSARIAAPLPTGELGALMVSLNQTAESLEHQRADIAQLDERLRQSQRLEAVGQLTGGIAHDFNNLLTVVLGNAEMLVEQCDADSPSREMAEMIAAAALRGAELTQRLLAFARKQALDPKIVDLNQLVVGIDGMLRRTLGEHIEIELISGAGLWPALVDQNQLENAMLNLCVNARDAMPGGGRLTIETANVELDAQYAKDQPDVLPGPYVLLAVSDTGEGISPENLRRVFEPFFTTKETGKGTGLGLAMVYGFVKQSAGHVAIYSEPGQGTTVKVYLPRAASGAATVEPETAERIGGGTETILLVEDDAGVRRQAVTQLHSLGYRVIEASDASSALTIIGQREDLDLLFTDVVMPGGMNGRALAEAAQRLRPGLRVLYTSGYTKSAIVHHGRLDPGALLLSKPYRRGQLDRAVRNALASPAPESAGLAALPTPGQA